MQGPYKFSGLSALILEVYGKNLPYYRCKAISVDLKNSENISFQPLYKNLNIINLKKYILLGDQQKAAFFKSVNEVPSGSYKTVVAPDRSTFEKVYEWEQ